MSISSKPKKRPEGPRQLSRRALERAKPIAARYQVTLWREDGEWYGRGVEEPGAMADGRTVLSCIRNLREALTAVVASNIEHGEPVVQPIVDRGRRRRAG